MARNLKIHLLIIDPQNDFLDIPGAALPVTGAAADMTRLAKFITDKGHKLEDIHVTLDSHQLIDIAHPAWWMDANGKRPSPFTLISAADIEAGIYTPRNPAVRARTLDYAHKLEASADHYKILVWPAHCLIGTWGHNVYSPLNDALQAWADKEYAMVDYVTKGSNPWTEHYGALLAEVPDPKDPSTSLNTQLLEILAESDIVLVGGEASSHCVLKTVTQIADNILTKELERQELQMGVSMPTRVTTHVTSQAYY